jgi:hypothetical protein
MTPGKSKKILKRIFLTLAVIVFILFSASFILSYQYKDKVVTLVVSELNKYLKTEVQVKNIDFSILRHFPNASIIFRGVTIKGTPVLKKKFKHQTDTLLTASSISLDFDIIKLIKKKYIFKSIHINEGKLNLLIDDKGNFNADIIKKDTSSNKNDNFRIKLSGIYIHDVKLHYENAAKKEILNGELPSLKVRGEVKSNYNDFKLKGQIHVNENSLEGIKYLKNKNLKASLDIANKNDDWSFNVGSLMLEDINLKVKGNIEVKDKTHLDINISSQGEEINTLLSLLPKNYIKYFKDYSLKGQMNFNSSIKGFLDYKTVPHIEAKFNISDATVKYSKQEMQLQNVKMEAIFSNGKKNSLKTSSFEVNNFSASIENSKISAVYGIKNFSNPHFYGKSYVQFDLKTLLKFLGVDTIEDAAGQVNGNILFSGNTSSLTYKKLKTIKSEGNLSLNNIMIKFAGNNTPLVNKLNSNLRFNNNTLEINNLNGEYKKQEISLRGVINNFMDLIFSDSKKLNGIFVLKAKKINLDSFIAKPDTSSSKNSIIESIKFDVNVDTLIYNNKEFTRVKAKGLYSNQKIILPDLYLKFGNGTVTGQIKYAADKIVGTVNFENLDIRKAMETFNNFGQNFISYKNIKGILSSNADFSCSLDQKGQIIPSSINVISDISIKNGELINFKPLESLSKFLSLEEVRHIYFTDIKNKIFIKNSRVIVPSMHIGSSSLDFDIEGYHTFDGDYEYHLKLLMSQLLSKKYRQKQLKQNGNNPQFAYNPETNQTKVFVLVENINGEMKIRYDKEKVKTHIKQRIKEEKESLKKIVKEEFHWFTKDTTIKKQKENSLKNKLKEKRKKEKQKQSGFKFEFGGK